MQEGEQTRDGRHHVEEQVEKYIVRQRALSITNAPKNVMWASKKGEEDEVEEFDLFDTGNDEDRYEFTKEETEALNEKRQEIRNSAEISILCIIMSAWYDHLSTIVRLRIQSH